MYVSLWCVSFVYVSQVVGLGMCAWVLRMHVSVQACVVVCHVSACVRECVCVCVHASLTGGD